MLSAMRWHLPLGSFAAVLAAGCAALAAPPQPGQSEAQVQQRLGAPTARYALAGGATRLEFATGPFGRETWMVDLDSAGRVSAARQVLEAGYLAAFQARAPGMSRDELLRELGRPGERRGARGGGETWSWRYVTNDCLWFQVSLDAGGRVKDGAFGIDPACDAPIGDRN
jgi:hypothetical protein